MFQGFMMISLILTLCLNASWASEEKRSDQETLILLRETLKKLENKFQNLNPDEVLKRASIEELDKIKNDFHDYKELLDGFSVFGSREKENYLSQIDARKTFHMIFPPFRDESFGSPKVLERIRKEPYYWNEHTPKNIVYLRYKQIVSKVAHVLDEKDRIEREKQEAIKKNQEDEARSKRIKELEETKRIQSSDDCIKAALFASYCDTQTGITLFSFHIDRERIISARSGVASTRIRKLTSSLMSLEERLEKTKNLYLKSKGTGPDLSNCVVIKPTGITDDHIRSKETEKLLSNLLATKCSVNSIQDYHWILNQYLKY